METAVQPAALVAAACLTLLALAHSVLGEREILGPLFAAEWRKPGPRWAMERLLRFAWHLTSMAWLALAGALVGASLPAVVAAMCLLSAAMVFVMLRGHLAWPLFALGGFAALHLGGWLSAPLLLAGLGAGLLVSLAAAALHFYWAGGGRWGLAVAAPPGPPGAPAFLPPPWACAAVGFALLSLAGLMLWVWAGGAPGPVRWALTVALALLALRAVGDGRKVGFTKRDRSSAFARWDDRLFTPLVLVLAAGSGAALIAG